MEHRHAVHLLTSVAGEGRHTELLTLVVRVRTAHADELIPRDAEFLRIATHVFAEEALVEIVVAGRHRCMDGIE